MKCADCGTLGVTGSACPDCGGGNLLDEAGSTTTTAPATTPDPPLMPAMPSMDITTSVTGPIIGTLVLPDGRRVDLHDGEEFLVAHETTAVDGVHLKVADETTSSTPVRIFAKDGKMFVTGGGGNGYAVVTTVRHKPTDEAELPRGGNLAVTAGKSTRLAIK